MRLIPLLLLLISLSHPAAAVDTSGIANSEACNGKSVTPGSFMLELDVDGALRRARLEVPEQVRAGESLPLVVNFHGVNANPFIIDAVTGMSRLGRSEGFVTATPAGLGASWNAGLCCNPAVADGVDDIAFTRALVEAIADDYCIAPDRIHVTGFSNGAAMAIRAACELTDVFASVAPVGGSVAVNCAPSRPIPALVLNNVEDPNVPIVLGELTFDLFVDRNTCVGKPLERRLSESTSCEIFESCEDGATTALCRTTGLGHTWPGGSTDPDGDFDATRTVWNFFENQEVPEPRTELLAFGMLASLSALRGRSGSRRTHRLRGHAL